MTSETKQYWEHTESLIDQGDLIGAWRSLQACDAMRTDNAPARTVLGCVLRLRGRYSGARELLQRAVISSPRCPGVLIELGRIAFELGDADDMPGEGWVADWLDVLIRLEKFTQLTTLINDQAGAGFPSTPGASPSPSSTGGYSSTGGQAASASGSNSTAIGNSSQAKRVKKRQPITRLQRLCKPASRSSAVPQSRLNPCLSAERTRDESVNIDAEPVRVALLSCSIR